MTKQEFFKQVSKNIKDYLPEEYRDAEISVDNAFKTSGAYTALVILKDSDEITPVVNLDKVYERIENYEPDEAVKETADVYLEAMNDMKHDYIVEMRDQFAEKMEDYDSVKESLFLAPVCLPEQNNISGIPHIMKADLPFVAKCNLMSDSEQSINFLVRNEMLEKWGVSKDEVFEQAAKTTEKVRGIKIDHIEDLIFGGKSDLSEESENRVGLLVVTNDNSTEGAGALFADGVLDRVADQVEGNYYVIPSSIHEVIVVPEKNYPGSPDNAVVELNDMVDQVNDAIVIPEDTLADETYHYDAEDKVFERSLDYAKRKAMEKTEVISSSDMPDDTYVPDDGDVPEAGEPSTIRLS